mgnify:CR=1 FL=1
MGKQMFYEGEVLDGKLHGKGKLTAPEGEILEGVFKDGILEGEAKIWLPNGDIYLIHVSDRKIIKRKLIHSSRESVKPPRPKKKNPFEPKHTPASKVSLFPGLFIWE